MAVWLVLTAIALLSVGDIVLWRLWGVDATITYVTRKAAAKWPLVPFLVGFVTGLVAGHLFWQ